MIVPFRLLIPTGNTPQNLFSTAANLIFASMISGASNTLQMFNQGALPTGPFAISRINLTCDTASVSIVFGVFNGTNFYECWRTLETDTATAGVLIDQDFTPKSRTVTPVDYLVVPQSNSYVPSFKLSAAPGAGVNIQGFIQIAPTVPGLGNIPAIIT